MARLCSICTHRSVDAINAAIIEHEHGYRAIARQYHVSRASLQRHALSHLRETIQYSKELTQMLSAKSLLARLSEATSTTLPRRC
jgi:hypothetical protein